jgi:UDP-N-acetylglucosamine diphosphorylase/glucosamine-1-phosphate N-acetyltransferase
VIFEDQTLSGFRPLAWSTPVAELRCGLLNPRERVAQLAGQDPVLLVRDFLRGLAAAGGHATTVDPGAEDLLLLSPRLGARWDLLERALAEAAAGPVAWRDAEGWLALSVPSGEAVAVLESWTAWEETAAAAGCWHDPGAAVPAWEPPLGAAGETVAGAWRRIWDLVPATAAAIAADLDRLAHRLPERRIWGAVPARPVTWTAGVVLRRLQDRPSAGVNLRGAEAVWLGEDCDLAAGVSIDARGGPVVLGREVRILPGAHLEGPLYIGSGSLVKAGACIYGESSLGAVCKVAGEIGETTFLDLVNKQHEGFIGHAYVGSWSNLGALTTCSDLKNTYGTIRVDLGAGAEDSGCRFVGLLMGEHGKTAIGTLFNTGTTVGFSSNVFGSGFPLKCLPSFTWGDGRGGERQDPQRALAVAETVMGRRDCRLTDGHEAVFRTLGAGPMQRA